MKTLFTLLFILISVASFSQNKKEKKALDSWIGHPKHELIQTMGLPYTSGTDGKGGEVYVYSRSVFVSGYTVYRITNFFIGGNGVIYSWSTFSSAQPPQPMVIINRGY